MNGRRLPDAIVYLKLPKYGFLSRVFDERAVRAKFEQETEKRREEKRLDREQKRQEYVQREEEIPEELGEQFDLEPEEDWPQLDKMIEEEKQRLRERREQDEQKLDELRAQLGEVGVPVFEIETERSIDQVFDRVNFHLRAFLQERQNLLEKYQVWQFRRPVPDEDADPESRPRDRLEYYEESYNFRKSRFHDRNPVTLIDTPKVREFPVVYRNRIYYLESAEQVEAVRARPLEYLTGQLTFPNDVYSRPRIFLVGFCHSGKSGLAKLLEAKLGLVRLKISTILSEYLPEMSDLTSKRALALLQEGRTLPDDLLVDIIVSRLQMRDCLQNGFVLDGFPQTRSQAERLTARGVVPYCVLSVQLDPISILQRSFRASAGENAGKFGYNHRIMHQKINEQLFHIPDTENYYLENFNDIIRFLPGQISKWGLFDQSYQTILTAIRQRQNFARSVITHQPVCVGQLPLRYAQIIGNLSQFSNYSPVSLKIRRLQVLNYLKTPHLVYYDKYIYVLNSAQEVEDFTKNPEIYIYQNLQKM